MTIPLKLCLIHVKFIGTKEQQGSPCTLRLLPWRGIQLGERL